MRRWLYRFILIPGICTAAGAGAGEIYKWTDAEGRIHFGDNAQAPDQSRKVELPPAQKSPPPWERWQGAGGGPVMPKPPELKDDVPMRDQVQANPHCAELARKIVTGMAHEEPTQALSDDLMRMCAGITMRCRTYRLNPAKNRCVAIRRTDKYIINNYQTDQ